MHAAGSAHAAHPGVATFPGKLAILPAGRRRRRRRESIPGNQGETVEVGATGIERGTRKPDDAETAPSLLPRGSRG